MVQSRFIDCQRPGAGSTPFHFTNFSVRSMILNGVGTAVNAVFPLVRRVATINFDTPIKLMSVTMASSIVNTTALDTVGVFVMLDAGDLLNLNSPDGGGFTLFLSHICRQNSVVGIPSSSSRSNAVVMGDESAYLLPSGQRLALYASSANAADSELSAVVSAYWTAAQ